MRLVGTTKPTIASIKDRSHWNTPNLVPQDPVTLGLCSQLDLDAEVAKASKRAGTGRAAGDVASVPGGTLMPTMQSVPGLGEQPDFEADTPATPEETAAEEEARMLATLKGMKGETETIPE